MQCTRIRDEELAGQKLEVLYGEADAEVRARVTLHLGECASCREEMVALARLRQDLKAWTLDERRPSVSGAIRGPWKVWQRAAAALIVGIGLGLAALSHVRLRQDLATQEARALERDRQYQQEIAALQAGLRERSLLLDPEGLLARVDERVREGVLQSEARQSQQLQASFSQWSGRMEARRRVDLARVAAGLSYLDGRQGHQLAQTNELMSYVLEAAAQER